MAESADKWKGVTAGRCPGEESTGGKLPVVGPLLKGLSQMTVREQQAVLIVLFLGLLGVGVKLWHLWRGVA
ncbi:MAG: hypothetical protein WCL44_12005 [bacterium]